jgi:hypothetical protein
MDVNNNGKKLIDYLKVIYPNNNLIHSIYSINIDGDKLKIIIGAEDDETDKKEIIFNNVLNYEVSSWEINNEMFPQQIIGFDYWISNDETCPDWEINGADYTWDFMSAFPEILDII